MRGPLRRVVAVVEGATITAVSAPGDGTAVINANTIDYTPGTDFNGNDTFTYTVADTLGGTSTATVTVYVGNATEGATRPDHRAR